MNPTLTMNLSLTIRMAGYRFGTVGTVAETGRDAMSETLCMAGDLHDAAVSRMQGTPDSQARAGDAAEALFILQGNADAITAALSLGCRGNGEAWFRLERQGTLSGVGITMEFHATLGEIETKG
jgi:hypothetical protein